MDEERLREIGDRAGRATPGFWRHRNDGVGDWVETLQGDNVAAFRHWWSAETGPDLHREDAEFIARARTDVPELVAEVRRLKKTSDYADILAHHIAFPHASNREQVDEAMRWFCYEPNGKRAG